MDTSKLRPETAKLWHRLSTEPALRGFVLIGGTALAMRLQHRVSEDLDFAFLGALLPQKRIAALIRQLNREGFALQANQDPLASEEFFDSGLDLLDHQQDFVSALQVKLSFVRFDNGTTQLLAGNADSSLRIATLDEIFGLKCLAVASRSKTRDWFDLYVLMQQHGYSGLDLHNVFMRANMSASVDIASQRLRQCRPELTDEGYAHLLAQAPTLDEMRDLFTRQLDAAEAELSAQAFRATQYGKRSPR